MTTTERATEEFTAVKALPFRYLKCSTVKALIRKNGKRPGRQFLMALDRFIERKVISACRVHNGGKKTLDAAVAGYVGIAAGAVTPG